MRKVIYFLFLVSTLYLKSSKAQTKLFGEDDNSIEKLLQSGTWQIDHILGLDIKTETYYLKRSEENRFLFGTLLNFYDSLHFTSGNYGWCGNDSFMKTYGKYKIADDSTLVFSVDSVSQKLNFETKMEYRKPNNLSFLISLVNESITFTKTK